MKKTALGFQCILEIILKKKMKNAMLRPGGELKAKTSWVSDAPQIPAELCCLVLKVDGILCLQQ